MPGHDVKLALEIYVAKADIQPETVRRLVETILNKHLGQYIELEKVTITTHGGY